LDHEYDATLIGRKNKCRFIVLPLILEILACSFYSANDGFATPMAGFLKAFGIKGKDEYDRDILVKPTQNFNME